MADDVTRLAGRERLGVDERVAPRLRFPEPVEGQRIAEEVLASLPTCPIPEIKRLGKTLKQWPEVFLAHFDTGRAINGGTEAINGLIELHRRIASGFSATSTDYACSSSAARCSMPTSDGKSLKCELHGCVTRVGGDTCSGPGLDSLPNAGSRRDDGVQTGEAVTTILNGRDAGPYRAFDSPHDGNPSTWQSVDRAGRAVIRSAL